MFGYVKPHKPQLRICEYEAYKAVYCGLCGQLGKAFGPAARLTLSYDFTFLAMICYAVGEEKPSFTRGRCHVNPVRRVPLCGESEALCFSADTATLMIYYKLLDNMHDAPKFQRLLWWALYPAARCAHRKAASRRPACDALIAESMSHQRELEEKHVASVDAACEPTARAMAGICRLLSEDVARQRILEQMGYHLGRYVYLCDALDDLEEDLVSGNYNPFVLRYELDKNSSSEECGYVCERARESLYATIAEAAKAWSLLTPEAFGPVLDNILLLGMRSSVDEIISKKEKIQ